MYSESFAKQPNEEFYIYGSILLNQDADERIVVASSSVSAVDAAGDDATAIVLDATTKQIYTDPQGSYTRNALAIRVQAGTEALSPYKITFLLVTNKGNTYEQDVRMAVRNV